MPQSDDQFQASLAKARKIERAVAAWLMSKGARILPVYDYSGLGEGKAPKLQAFSASDSLVTPDLLVARRGCMSWCEVKWKTSAFHFRKTNEFETGIDLRLWNQYQRVKKITGCRVFLVFVHEAEDTVTCDEIGLLDSLPNKRVSSWGRPSEDTNRSHPPMVNWPLRVLHPLATYRQVVPSEAA